METGFDCEFVGSISKDVQTECSICLQILRRPHIVSCCGYRFCGGCLDEIQKTRATLGCPLCKQSFSAIPDKGLERVLNAKIVSCSFKKSGCPWIGQLSQLESHLNSTPSSQSDILLEGCPFFEIVCPRCRGKPIQRQNMRKHSNTECPKREVVCLYCNKRLSYENIVGGHYDVCPRVPVPCPKGCSAKPLRKNIDSHVAKTCPKNSQLCPFSVVGCSKMLAGSGMESHLKDKSVLAAHLSLIKKSQESFRKQLEEEVKKKDCQIASLQDQVRERDMKLKVEIGKMNDVHERKIKEEISVQSSWIEAFTKEVEEKDRQIQQLKRKSSCDDHSLRSLKSDNAALTKKTCAQKLEIDKLTDKNQHLVEDLSDQNYYVKALERTNADLCEELDRVTKETQDLRVQMLEDGDSNNRANKGEVPGDNPPVNAPTDENGVLGAAIGVALGVGIAGVAALLRR